MNACKMISDCGVHQQGADVAERPHAVMTEPMWLGFRWHVITDLDDKDDFAADA